MNQKCELTKKSCKACRGDLPSLKGEELDKLHQQLKEGWHIVDGHHLEKTYTFSNFKLGLLFTINVGELAEQEGHHPDIHLSYGKVTLSIWTHKVDGLTESDFILAAKCDEV